MASVIRKKAKAKRQRQRKEAKSKQYPKRSKKMLKAPQSLPFRDIIEAQVHESSRFLNEVIRPIESTRTVDKTKPFDKQVDQAKLQIMEMHKERVRSAGETFSELTNAIEQADAVVQILDARDPTACRLCEAENEVLQAKKKPMIFVINKIDLVPREAVVGWINELKSVAPTIAVSALNNQASMPVIQAVIASTAPNAKKIAIIGIAGVGKSTFCRYNPSLFIEVPSYTFIATTPEMELLQGCDCIDSMYDLAIQIMARKTDDDLFLALEIPAQETPDAVVKFLAKKWQMKPHIACKKFVEMFWNRSIPYFAIPSAEASVDGMEQTQIAALQVSLPVEMSAKVFVHLSKGDTIALDNKLLGVQDEDEEENDEEEEDESDE
ncbi:hypothetical protein TRFO_30396 [Tritrichomonas foetus]|uniref:Guanine nucleotide-binding protein-like 3 N-terminal domain-containing protein n=1 Tax=Tritrichomonas foetus TaxID=1144522 RepID=A0A1J4JTZ1_9EUKA|nr:hypothetical protein TRFO_30396 [Tritrichomonas foetus]|eukprot:OHT02499.1 hypothetical protein TRFO_30396 [Tritrichomonas foetus]